MKLVFKIIAGLITTLVAYFLLFAKPADTTYSDYLNEKKIERNKQRKIELLNEIDELKTISKQEQLKIEIFSKQTGVDFFDTIN
jgi:hypothetical protein